MSALCRRSRFKIIRKTDVQTHGCDFWFPRHFVDGGCIGLCESLRKKEDRKEEASCTPSQKHAHHVLLQHVSCLPHKQGEDLELLIYLRMKGSEAQSGQNWLTRGAHWSGILWACKAKCTFSLYGVDCRKNAIPSQDGPGYLREGTYRGNLVFAALCSLRCALVEVEYDELDTGGLSSTKLWSPASNLKF